MIQAENLTKQYGDKKALNNVSFQINPGEIIGLVGKNGAGKSTSLRILSGQMVPTEGDVLIDGISVTENPTLTRPKVGYLPQTPPLYREMRTGDFLRFAARLRKVPENQVESRVAEVARETGLTHVLEDRVGNLSHGYQQRVGIAQALAHKPPVILLDEPMSGLDPVQIVQIRDLILSLRGKHTVLFSSHILSEITHVSDRVILIDQGEVKAVGSEAELRGLVGKKRLEILVRGEKPALKSALEKLKEVSIESLETVAGGLLRAVVSAPEDGREAISQACVSNKLGLLEFKGESDGLENLFFQLIQAGNS